MKTWLRSVAAVLVIGLFPGLPVRAGAVPLTLTLNHQFPATALGSKIDQWFADEVKQASKGEVEIRIFWSGAMGAARENLVMLKNGTIDMAAMSAGYFPAELPDRKSVV